MNLFIKEQELEKCVLEQLLNRKAFEEKFTDHFIRLLENESSLFLFSFKRELESHNQLREIESLFEFIGEIKDIYTRCIDIFNKNLHRITSPEIKEILQGITETLLNGLGTFPDDFDNMIVIERMSMISEAISKMKNLIRNSISSYMSTQLSNGFFELDIRKMMEMLLEHVLESNMVNLKELHTAAMKELNQFDKRVQGRRYMSLVSTIKKNIEVFKSIQPENMEDLAKYGQELQIFKTIILIVHEIYVKLEMKEQQMYQVVNQKNFSMETINKSFEALMGFDQIMDHMVENEELMNCFHKFISKKQAIITNLTIGITDELRKTIMFSIQEIVEASKEIQLVGCQIVQCLKIADKGLKALHLEEIPLSEDVRKVLSGIVETLHIKCEAIKEKEYEYTLAKKENIVAYEKQLIDFSDLLLLKIASNFEEMLCSERRPFLEAHESFKKIFHQQIDHNFKFDLAYLKTDLISEIITLEELVKFSLPKLLSQEHVSVKEAVRIIQKTYESIEKILKKAGIESLEPKSHDKFNGKEHEVIFVEVVESFQKGEIVSVHTKGYKIGVFIILRANVIAAK